MTTFSTSLSLQGSQNILFCGAEYLWGELDILENTCKNNYANTILKYIWDLLVVVMEPINCNKKILNTLPVYDKVWSVLLYSRKRNHQLHFQCTVYYSIPILVVQYGPRVQIRYFKVVQYTQLQRLFEIGLSEI